MPGARVSEGDRLTLRTVEEEDDAFCQRAAANPELRVPLGTSLRARREMNEIREAPGVGLLACLEDGAGPGTPAQDETTPIGWVGTKNDGPRRPELVYWLVPEHQGAGYGREMLTLAIDYVFATNNHPAVGASVYGFNDDSRGLLESLGFEEEGCLRNYGFIDGEYVDSYQYGLLREEWLE